MNILMVVPWYKPQIGGVVYAAEKLAKALVRQNHKVIILKNGNNYLPKKVADDAGVPVYSLEVRPLFHKEYPIRSILSFIFYLFPTIFGLLKLIRENEIDIVNISYPLPTHIYFYILRKFWRLRYIITFNGSDLSSISHLSRPAYRCMKFLIKDADALVAVSGKINDSLKNNYPSSANRIHLIYNSVDPLWANSVPQHNYNIDGKYIFSLATAKPVKGQDILIKAFAKVAAEFADIHLVIAGSGPNDEEYDQLIRESGLRRRVMKLGDVAPVDLPPLLRNCLFGMIPSRNEGFPIAALEFGLVKKPVVATRVGGLPEFVENGQNGFLVESEDISAMTDKMMALIKDPTLIERMGENAYKLVMEKFTVNIMAEKYLKVYQDCRGGGKGRQ